MHEGFISRTSLIATMLWTAMVVLFAAAWAIAITHHDWWLWAGMLSATGLGVSAIAATTHIRLYALRMCSLIRATSSAQGGDRREIHSIR